MFILLTVSAVEIDIPWKSEQTEQHGPSFKAWTENEFMPFLQAHDYITLREICLSCNLSYIIICLQVYHSSAQTHFVQQCLRDKAFASITDFYIIKTGHCLFGDGLFRCYWWDEKVLSPCR